MKFRQYIRLLESSPSKRAVINYPSIYPPQYGLTYRLQYSPSSLKRKKKKK